MTSIGSVTTSSLPLPASSPASTRAAASAPVTLDRVREDVRSSFSTRELGAFLDAFAPAVKNLSPDAAADAVAGLLRQLAERRAAGEDAVFVGTEVPGGGFIGTIMNASEFARALASDDRESLGWFKTDDGRTLYVRDALRGALGMEDVEEEEAAGAAEAVEMSTKDRIAAAVAAMLEKNAAEAKGEDGGRIEGEVRSNFVSLKTGADGSSSTLLVFGAEPKSTPHNGRGAILDVHA